MSVPPFDQLWLYGFAAMKLEVERITGIRAEDFYFDPDTAARNRAAKNQRKEDKPMPDNSEGFSYSRLIKLLGMTTASNDGEALAAMRMANRELDRLGKTWHEFIMSKITVVADPFAQVPTPPSTPTADAYGRPCDWRNATAPSRPTPPPPPRRPQPTPPRPPAAGTPDYSYMSHQSQRPRAQPDPFKQTSGRPAKAKQPGRTTNRFAGLCAKCKERVGVGEGEAFLDGKFASGKDRWAVEHTPGTCPQKAKPAPVKGSMSDLDDMMKF